MHSIMGGISTGSGKVFKAKKKKKKYNLRDGIDKSLIILMLSHVIEGRKETLVVQKCSRSVVGCAFTLYELIIHTCIHTYICSLRIKNSE